MRIRLEMGKAQSSEEKRTEKKATRGENGDERGT